MTNTENARNDNDDSTTDEDGQLANPGPVPPAPEDAADTDPSSVVQRD